jgi:cellulose synthase (UDP-forming)
MLLYLAEMYSVLMLALSLFIVADAPAATPVGAGCGGGLPGRRRLRAELQRDDKLLANTLAAAKAMDYPPEKLTSTCSMTGAQSRSASAADVASAEAARRAAS